MSSDPLIAMEFSALTTPIILNSCIKLPKITIVPRNFRKDTKESRWEQKRIQR